jgi:hypothetical protein
MFRHKEKELKFGVKQGHLGEQYHFPAASIWKQGRKDHMRPVDGNASRVTNAPYEADKPETSRV